MSAIVDDPVLRAKVGLFLPYQGGWIAGGLGRGWKLRLAEKSRRIGITWAEAYRQTILASSADGCDCFYVSTSQILGRDYIDVVAQWARGLEEAMPGRIVKRILADKVEFMSGHSVTAVTSSPRALRGKGGDVVVDEAAHHVDLEAMLKAASAVGKWSPYGLTLISTHNGADNLFAQIADEIRDGKRRGILHRVDLREACAQGLYRRICAVNRMIWTPEAERRWIEEALEEPGAEEEYLVIPARGSGVYFRLDLLTRQADPELPVLHWKPGDDFLHAPDRDATVRAWCVENLDPLIAALPPRLPVGIGSDFARSGDGDLSSFAVSVEQRDLSLRFPISIELRGVPHAVQEEILKWLIDGIGRRLRGVKIDAAGNGSSLAEFAVKYVGDVKKRGKAERVTMSREWKVTYFGRFRRRLEEGTVWIPADVDVRDDFRLVRLLPGGIPSLPPNKRTRSTRDGGKRHGDVAVAMIAAGAVFPETPKGRRLAYTPRRGVIGDRGGLF
jgi:phage FluMu gp28-like protein